MTVHAEELFAGAKLTHEVELPSRLLASGADPARTTVVLRPLTVRDIQLIARAAREDDLLTSALMVQQARVEPALRAEQVLEMPGGLVRFLVERINAISGLTTTDDDVREMTESPLVQAFFALAREFQWTPEQVRELTVAQVLGYLQLINQSRQEAAP